MWPPEPRIVRRWAGFDLGRGGGFWDRVRDGRMARRRSYSRNIRCGMAWFKNKITYRGRDEQNEEGANGKMKCRGSHVVEELTLGCQIERSPHATIRKRTGFSSENN